MQKADEASRTHEPHRHRTDADRSTPTDQADRRPSLTQKEEELLAALRRTETWTIVIAAIVLSALIAVLGPPR